MSRLAILTFVAAAGMAPATTAQAQARVPVGVRLELSRDSGPSARPLPRDAWFAPDKVRHAGTSAAIQLMGFGLLRLAGASKRESLVGATLVTAAAGLGKEVRDARGGGEASARDLMWDALGILAGTALARLGDGR